MPVCALSGSANDCITTQTSSQFLDLPSIPPTYNQPSTAVSQPVPLCLNKHTEPVVSVPFSSQ